VLKNGQQCQFYGEYGIDFFRASSFVSNITEFSASSIGVTSSGGLIVTTSLSICPKLAPHLFRYASAVSSAFDNSLRAGVSFFWAASAVDIRYENIDDVVVRGGEAWD
jgi:hypothetical protein